VDSSSGTVTAKLVNPDSYEEDEMNFTGEYTDTKEVTTRITKEPTTGAAKHQVCEWTDNLEVDAQRAQVSVVPDPRRKDRWTVTLNLPHKKPRTLARFVEGDHLHGDSAVEALCPSVDCRWRTDGAFSLCKHQYGPGEDQNVQLYWIDEKTGKVETVAKAAVLSGYTIDLRTSPSGCSIAPTLDGGTTRALGNGLPADLDFITWVP